MSRHRRDILLAFFESIYRRPVWAGHFFVRACKDAVDTRRKGCAKKSPATCRGLDVMRQILVVPRLPLRSR